MRPSHGFAAKRSVDDHAVKNACRPCTGRSNMPTTRNKSRPRDLTSLWRVTEEGDPRNKPRAVEPGMPQRRLSCRLGNGGRFNDDATSGTAQFLSWRGDPAGEGVEGPRVWRSDIHHRESEKTFSEKKGCSFVESGSLRHDLATSNGAIQKCVFQERCIVHECPI